ncbi:hypothetical protein PYW08_003343 [Mythimna loreyi]|uniref:Uncharacterized protein n=1 Tax=Mythimna loreyi TaxID=667449 RepID=A0ACC2QT49_9NEOP|nr:hypothetical protein PYW08_003343 [Mythimna loreyi]
MKSFAYVALVVFFVTVLVEGYGPQIRRKNIGGWSKSSHRNKPSPGPPHGPPQRPPHHGFPPHWPHHDHFRPPNRHDFWDDDSPVWSGGSDSRDSSGESDNHSGDDYDSYDNMSPERDGSDSSYEDSGDWFGRHSTKRPCKKPHTKKPPNTTHRPIQTTNKPRPTTPEPRPTTSKPIPTTTETVVRPTRTVGPIPPITNRPPWHPTTTTETTTDSIPETTSSNPDVETTTEEEFITLSPEMEECINTCPSTPEFNPVCGSDDQTYPNEGKLFCASSCTGLNITIKRRSVCPPPNFDDGGQPPGPPPPPPPTTTTESPLARTTPFSNFERCMRLCAITPSFTPVCGTDLITYMNMDRLKCAQSCGEAVEVLCEKPCAACGFNPVTIPTTTTLRPRTTTQISRSSTEEPAVQECIDACPVTTEYNPVCGSNGVTYNNPSRLLCAQLCGVGVIVTRLGPCGFPTTTSTTTTVAVPTTLPPNVLDCIRRCPVTSEYNPVCGTDDLTYNNLGHLHCSSFCGVQVEFKHNLRCTDEFDLGPDETDTTPSSTTKDVNENKDPQIPPWRTTVTTSSVFTSPTTTTTTIPPTTTTSTSTTKAGSDSSSTFGFTIPNDILIDIFGSSTTQTSVTKPTNPDDDEDLDLDTRFSNDTGKHTGRTHHSRVIYPD